MFSRNFKNTVVVSLGFLFLFTAFQALQNLQVSGKPKMRNLQFIVLKALKDVADMLLDDVYFNKSDMLNFP